MCEVWLSLESVHLLCSNVFLLENETIQCNLTYFEWFALLIILDVITLFKRSWGVSVGAEGNQGSPLHRLLLLLPAPVLGNPLYLCVFPHKQSRLAGRFEGILITCYKPQPAPFQTMLQTESTTGVWAEISCFQISFMMKFVLAGIE